MFVDVNTTIWVALLTEMGLWESVTIGTNIGGIEGTLLRDDDIDRIPGVWSWVPHLRI